MFSRFFIDRPIFASVLSIVVTLAGALSLVNLPLAMYPQIAPPTVQVDCKYPGASADVVAQTVAAPIEQQVNGVEGMLYMSSQCTNDGSYNLTVTFQHGMDLNMAQVLVQNKVALALPNLPDVIKQAGVTARKRSPDILMAIALNAPNGGYDQLYLSNYATMHVKDELARLPGISDVTMLGQQDYSMRIWVDPDRLASLNMTAGDVVNAIREQNRPVATGQIGQPPVAARQPIQITLDTQGRLINTEEFGDIIVRSLGDGRTVRLRDVARVEIAAKNSDISTRVNGIPSISLAIFQLPEANALETADVVKAKIKELEKNFPPGIRYEIRYDTTPFIRESIQEVFKTLGESIILVAVVVLLFLQNWRSAVIPLIAVPVAIVGTFAVMLALGFSINNLTLFGLVLAIGIVVDDAIVVVESVEHHMEHGLSARDATAKAMDEVSGPVIAIGLVLSAVFVPCAFISGIVGQFFRQFALTIAASTLISTFNSLTLSPALAALLLKPPQRIDGRLKRPDPLPKIGIAIICGWFFHSSVAPHFWAWYHSSSWLSLWSVGAASSVAGAVEYSRSQFFPLLSRLGEPGEVISIAFCCLGLFLGFVFSRQVNWCLSAFFSAFNSGFKRLTGAYASTIAILIRGVVVVVLLYLGLLYLTEQDFKTTPKGFIPSQDMGYLLCNVQLPDAASLERTQEVMNKMERAALSVRGVRFTQSMTGQSLLLSAFGSNFGSMFIILDPFADRPNPTRIRFWRWLEKRRLPDAEDLLFYRYVFGKRLTLPKDESLAAQVEKIVRRLPGQSGFQRPSPGELNGTSLYGEEIAARLRRRFESEIPDAIVTVLGPPPIRGVGRAGGFKLMVEDRGDIGLKNLQDDTEKLTAMATSAVFNSRRTRPLVPGQEIDGESVNPDELRSLAKIFVGMTSVFRANVPQLYADVNRAESMTKQVALRDLFESLQVYLGSLYVNDFNLFGRTWQVIVQAEPRFRNTIDDVRRLTVRNAQRKMVPIGTVADIQERNGPLILTRYNMYTAAPINGSAAPGVSSGEAIAAMEVLARNVISPTSTIEWTELAYLELQAGNTAMVVFGFAVVMVFLVLAAQYESWALPLAVILVVPMCLLCSIEGVNLADEDINIFTQIGFVVLVGLACKNAILIVEFARAQRLSGKPRNLAALDACRLRLRPIVMTSLAFVLGVFPLLFPVGAGAEMRRTLGVTVFSGMLGVTLFGLLLTPVFFVLVDWVADLKVFRSRAARSISRFAQIILSFGLVLLIERVAEFARQTRRSRPSSNGRDGSQNGHTHGVVTSLSTKSLGEAEQELQVRDATRSDRVER